MKIAELKALLISTFGHLDDKQLMGLTIYGEARGECDEGKIAVGSIILERVDHRDWDGKTIREVCLMPFQFSCYLPNDPNFTALKCIAQNWQSTFIRSMDLQDCYHTACDLIAGRIPRTPEIVHNHATQYLTTALRKTKQCPAWVSKSKLVAVIGHHEFYA